MNEHKLDYIVDTDVWSFLFKNDTRAESYRAELIGKRIGISAQTLAELMRGARAANWSAGRIDLMLRGMQRFQLVPLGGEIALLWAEVRHMRDRVGNPITATDAWVAATALGAGCPLMTHNARHFGQIDGLKIFSVGTA